MCVFDVINLVRTSSICKKLTTVDLFSKIRQKLGSLLFKGENNPKVFKKCKVFRLDSPLSILFFEKLVNDSLYHLP